MRHLFVVTILLGLLPLPVFAAPPTAEDGQARMRSFIALTQQPLQLSKRHQSAPTMTVPLPGDVDSPLVADVYVPQQCAASRPCPMVLLVHGALPDAAPVRPRQWQVYRDWGATLAAHGVVAVVVDHTLGHPQRRLDQATNELKRALDWMGDKARPAGWDQSRLSIVTYSAGGLLVPELLRQDAWQRISRIAMLYPLTGVVPGSPSEPLVEPTVRQRLEFGSAIHILAKRRIPVLVVRAGADEIPGLLPLLDVAMSTAAAAGVELELYALPRAKHGFDSTQDLPEGQRVIGRAISFVNE